ncbi:MAG: glucosaminidase domain-containing protein [Clostridia bacterium]|nr:glucosaminidase domain-containing protein [Clostridia bacterium]
MNKNNNDYKADVARLSNLFKEVQDIRYGRAEAKVLPNEKEEIKFNRIYVVDHRFNAIGAIIGVLFIILFMMTVKGNYIFASSEDERIAIDTFEANKNAINIIDTISENISDFTKKDIINREIDVEIETKYVETNLLPKDEQIVVQEGTIGKIEQTVILTYENGKLISESVVGETIKVEAVEKIIEVGTSEFLLENQVHIDDVMYTTEEIEMYGSKNEDDLICYIYQHINVIILEEDDGWAKISVDGLEGYIKSEYITSEAVTPGIAEKSRIKRLEISIKPEMLLNKPSGLTKDDFKKVLSGIDTDSNKIFENNAEVFFEMEQKYNINGIFLAALGMHESNWGTSTIAQEKRNLFGYGAYDSSAYESSFEFESYEEGIETVAKSLVKNYLNEAGTEIYDGETASGTYYNGATLAGVNIRYASDTNWATRIYNIMVSLYENL